jgi:hypothetical protein
MSAEYRSFREFYPAYLAEHTEKATRRLHFIGTLLVLVAIGMAVWMRDARWLIAAPILGYGLAWIGHFVFAQPPGHIPASALQPGGRLRDVQRPAARSATLVVTGPVSDSCSR